MKNNHGFAAPAGLFVVLPLGTAAGGPASDLEEVLVHCDVAALSDTLEQGASANRVQAAGGASALNYAVECEPDMAGTQYKAFQDWGF